MSFEIGKSSCQIRQSCQKVVPMHASGHEEHAFFFKNVLKRDHKASLLLIFEEPWIPPSLHDASHKNSRWNVLVMPHHQVKIYLYQPMPYVCLSLKNPNPNSEQERYSILSRILSRAGKVVLSRTVVILEIFHIKNCRFFFLPMTPPLLDLITNPSLALCPPPKLVARPFGSEYPEILKIRPIGYL
jgi:hypothetical protein